jgi:hypothetical protein
VSGKAQGWAGLAAAFAEMPLVLKGVTSFFAVFGAGSLVLSLAPGIEHRVAGETLGPGGLWRSGLGPSALVLGLWLLACAWGLLQRSAWSCWGVVLAGALLVAAERAVAAAGAPGASASPGPALQAALAAAWAIAAWVYLFRTRGARRFFRPPPHGAA